MGRWSPHSRDDFLARPWGALRRIFQIVQRTCAKGNLSSMGVHSENITSGLIAERRHQLKSDFGSWFGLNLVRPPYVLPVRHKSRLQSTRGRQISIAVGSCSVRPSRGLSLRLVAPSCSPWPPMHKAGLRTILGPWSDLPPSPC